MRSHHDDVATAFVSGIKDGSRRSAVWYVNSLDFEPQLLGACPHGREDRFGIRLLETWGQTETASVWLANHDRVPGAIGKSCPRAQFRVVPVANVSAGYASGAALFERAFFAPDRGRGGAMGVDSVSLGGARIWASGPRGGAFAERAL